MYVCGRLPGLAVFFFIVFIHFPLSLNYVNGTRKIPRKYVISSGFTVFPQFTDRVKFLTRN